MRDSPRAVLKTILQCQGENTNGIYEFESFKFTDDRSMTDD